jgi:hypothetical protein
VSVDPDRGPEGGVGCAPGPACTREGVRRSKKGGERGRGSEASEERRDEPGNVRSAANGRLGRPVNVERGVRVRDAINFVND